MAMIACMGVAGSFGDLWIYTQEYSVTKDFSDEFDYYIPGTHGVVIIIITIVICDRQLVTNLGNGGGRHVFLVLNNKQQSFSSINIQDPNT